jgi:hypothetical protein
MQKYGYSLFFQNQILFFFKYVVIKILNVNFVSVYFGFGEYLTAKVREDLHKVCKGFCPEHL